MKIEAGSRVAFAHQPWQPHKVTRVFSNEGQAMVELDDMTGEFAASIFVTPACSCGVPLSRHFRSDGIRIPCEHLQKGS